MLPFLTDYDPLGGSSGSIDPLGALQTYASLAELLLPGVTTITNRSRYLTMMCAALANAESQPLLPGASGLAQRRKAVEPFERFWALACVAAQEAGNARASDGLRGISYAEASYKAFKSKGEQANCDFPLLKYQARTGAVGTYWTALAGAELIDPDSGALTDEGFRLGKEFPEPPLDEKDRTRLRDAASARRVSMSLDELLEWGEGCHLQAATRVERQQLADALTADDRRDCVSRALYIMESDIPSTWDIASLRKLRRSLASVPRSVELGIPIVVDAILVTEQFHEAVLVVFQTMLWWGTVHSGRPTAELRAEGAFGKLSERCRQTAQALREFREGCDRPEVREGTDGLLRFAAQIERSKTATDLISELLHRHHHVQSGKLDGGMPKRDWITWDGTALLRPSPQFQRSERPALARGAALTHPYRIEPFVQMLRENHVLRQA